MDQTPSLSRLLWAGAGVGAICLMALLFFPPLVAIPVYLLAPVAVALFLAGGKPDAYVRIGLTGAVTAGLVSLVWTLVLADAGIVPRIIGAIAGFVILSSLASFVCYLAGRFFFRNTPR
jgi:hypothetical protein